MRKWLFLLAGLVSTGIANADLAFVPDRGNGTVFKFDLEDGTYRGLIAAGFFSGTTLNGVGQSPYDGLLYVCQRIPATNDGQVLRFDPYTGEYKGSLGRGFVVNPKHVTFDTTGNIYVSDTNANGGAVVKFVASTGEYKGIQGVGFLTADNTIGPCARIVGNRMYANASGGTAIARFDYSTGQYLGLIASGFVSATPPLTTTSTQVYANQVTSGSAVFRFDQADGAYRGILATGFLQNTRGLAFTGDDMLLVRGGSSAGTDYVVRFEASTGRYMGHFGYGFLSGSGIDVAVEQPANMVVRFILQDWVGGAVANVPIEIRDPSTNAVLQTIVIPSVVSGVDYTIQVKKRGNVVMSGKPWHWLRKNMTANVPTGGSTTPIVFNVLNGDCDADPTGDNVIDLTDYLAIANAFNALLSDPNNGGLPSPNWVARADVNGDGVVDLTDYTVVAVNFNALGDN